MCRDGLSERLHESTPSCRIRALSGRLIRVGESPQAHWAPQLCRIIALSALLQTKGRRKMQSDRAGTASSVDNTQRAFG
ncbi:hypothetical protein ElyMa_006146800 [Elysia marginata]|uniref:Uncharacterized protein n=1 Tax=Elysia marginata TaxID=1093978 RepID=A0AAV4GXU8_9GAST|nr:hypothetical protein ElyMa_006146800 [Elysia marginata]